MLRVFSRATPFLLALMVISYSPLAYTGVIISKTVIVAGLGPSRTRTVTVYLQGNKRKIDEARAAAITDLDKHIVYILDKQNRSYLELPLRKINATNGTNKLRGATSVLLHPSGRSRTVGEYPCKEYLGVRHNQRLQISVNACVASNLPGAHEMQHFDQELISDLAGHHARRLSRSKWGGLLLERRFVASFRTGKGGNRAPRQLSRITTISRVKSIRIRPLARAIFVPPKDFQNLHYGEPKPSAGLRQSRIERPSKSTGLAAFGFRLVAARKTIGFSRLRPERIAPP